MTKLKNTNILLKRDKISDIEFKITNSLKPPYMLNTNFLLNKYSDDVIINIKRKIDICTINININKKLVTDKKINILELTNDINENYKNIIFEEDFSR